MLSTKPWRAESVIQYGAAVFACICLGVVAVEALRQLGVGGFGKPGGPGAVVVTTLSFQGAACLLAGLFLRQHQVRLGDGLGWRGPRAGRAVALGAAAILLALPVVWWLQAASVTILTNFGETTDAQLAVRLLRETDSLWLRIYMGVFAIGIAPVAEEFLFRGLLYPACKQSGWPRLALVGTSLLFALIHFDRASFLPLFVLALVLTWVYEETDNLLAPIMAHAVFNGANLLVLAWQELDRLSVTK